MTAPKLSRRTGAAIEDANAFDGPVSNQNVGHETVLANLDAIVTSQLAERQLDVLAGSVAACMKDARDAVSAFAC